MLSYLKNEFKLFLSAMMFFTRIPVYHLFDDCPKFREAHLKYLPMVGWIIGGVLATTYIISSFFFKPELSVLITMIFGIILTGAFHEDGLADTADGIGGGFTTQKILTIMKDSRLGTYGAITLFLALLLKYSLLKNFSDDFIPKSIVISQSLSRIFPLLMVKSSSYITEEDKAKSKFVAEGITNSGLIFGIVIGVIPFAFLGDSLSIGIEIIMLLISFYFIRKFFIDAIGGYTGDILGATQQIFEILILIFLLLSQRF